MATIETKYSIGDIVWYAGTTTEQRQHPCPDCNGTKQWRAESPAGDAFTFACPRCSTSYGSFNELSIAYTAHTAALRRLTIGSVRHDSSPTFSSGSPTTYMCVETGVGGGSVYDESRLFPTEEKARVCAEAAAAVANSTMKHIVQRYNQTLSISDYQLTSGLMKIAKDERSKAGNMLWNLNDLFTRIEEAEGKDDILEAVEAYKRHEWARDKAAIEPQPEPVQ